MITLADLIDASYKEYRVGHLHDNWAAHFAQKAVADERGIKYFINAYIAKPLVPHGAQQIQCRVTIETPQGNSCITLWPVENIPEMEAFFESAFKSLNAKYRSTNELD